MRIFLTDMESSVINNGYSTGYYPVNRGCRQGDPISAYLFILVMEILSNMVANDVNIQGLNINNVHVKLVMFADDSTFILKDIESLKNLEIKLEYFSKYTSLHLNQQKSEIAWLGAAKNNPGLQLGYNWKNLNYDCIKILGIYFTYNEQIKIKNNFDKVQNNLISVLRYWRSRNLSIFGKVTIIKSLVISKINYVCNVMIPPMEFVGSVKENLLRFLWNDGTAKIKYSSIISGKHEGGLKFPDIDSIIKTRRILWLKRFLNENDSLWKIIPKYYFEKAGILLVDINFDKNCVTKGIPSFYKSCLYDWSDLFNKEPVDIVNVIAQPLWNNHLIKNGNGESYKYKEFSDIGLNHLIDIITPEGKFNQLKELNIPPSQIYKWLILKHSIKKEWIKIVQNGIMPVNVMYFPYMTLKNKIVKLDKLSNDVIYEQLMGIKQQIPSGRLYFEKLAKKEIDWNTAYKNIYKATIEVRLRVFQFKILHNVLPTNNILHRWKILDSPRCSFCFIAEETIHHLFCECHRTITLYLQIKELLDKCDINLPDINVNYILTGVPPTSPSHSLINHILILYKYCVYMCRENEFNLNLNYFLSVMKDTEKTERIIAKNANRYSKHLMKWEKVLGLF